MLVRRRLRSHDQQHPHKSQQQGAYALKNGGRSNAQIVDDRDHNRSEHPHQRPGQGDIIPGDGPR